MREGRLTSHGARGPHLGHGTRDARATLRRLIWNKKCKPTRIAPSVWEVAMSVVNRAAWLRFGAVAAPFFRSELRWRAAAFLGALATLLLGVNALNVVNSFVGRDFMTAVADRDAGRYPVLALLYVGVFAASTAV